MFNIGVAKISLTFTESSDSKATKPEALTMLEFSFPGKALAAPCCRHIEFFRQSQKNPREKFKFFCGCALIIHAHTKQFCKIGLNRKKYETIDKCSAYHSL